MPDAANSALSALAFFEGSALVFLLVVYAFLSRESARRYFRFWISGWSAWTTCGLAGLFPIGSDPKAAKLALEELYFAGTLLLFASILEYTGRRNRLFWVWPFGFLAAGCLAVLAIFGYQSDAAFQGVVWIDCALCVGAGWILWNSPRTGRGWAGSLAAVVLLLLGLHGIDRLDWPAETFSTVRFALGGLLQIATGVAMALLVLETRRAGSEEQTERVRGMGMVIATASESHRVERLLQEVLPSLLECLGASHAVAYLLDSSSENPTFVLRASVGFSGRFLATHYRLPASEPWVSQVLEKGSPCDAGPGGSEREVRLWADAEKLSFLTLVPLPGKPRAIGLLGIGSEKPLSLEAQRLEFLRRVLILLSVTIQNARRVEETGSAQRLWTDTFDSIGDLMLVHGMDYRILCVNRALTERLSKTSASLEGVPVREILRRGTQEWNQCPYCERNTQESWRPDPTFGGHFQVSSSNLEDANGFQRGVIHVLKDFTGRQEAESKFRVLFEKMQEGVFISTPQGRFLDFNDAFQRMLGYESRKELLKVDIGQTIYAEPAERERLKRILHEHGEVTDFEFQVRRRDGEIRTLKESSFVVRGEAGAVVAYQGFVLDVTDRREAELELRRRNHELMLLNAIAEMLSQSPDLKEVLGRALQKIVELFGADLGAIYLLDEKNEILTRTAATGHQSEYAREFPPTKLSEGPLLKTVRQAHATVLSATGLPLPEVFRDLQRKEGVLAAPLVVLWSKDRIVGALVVGSRSVREFSPAELNLLAAVGSQLAATIDKSLLHQETIQAYENLRRAQEQLLQSEKMAAIGQLISGVAHELNNPLTAILGYGQLLRADELLTQRGSEYLEKLSKQAQRTHHIVQNLLSFARQHKPERRPVQLNKILDDTLFLREYDLKMHNVNVHREFDPHLPSTAGDFHQLQQVFLNILNNAMDAVLESTTSREIWIRTSSAGKCLLIEFTDSGPGVQDARRVFDPFYTTKPVGKGTGLGLSICYGIVKEHGGEISARNAAPRGATFTVSLPITPISFMDPGLEIPAETASSRGSILLVESEEAVLEIEQDILRQRRLKVQAVRTGREALQLLEKEVVDGVVMEVQIPGEISGWGLYRWIESHRPELASHVVFTFSSGGEEEARVLVGNSGCQALQKPFDVEEFWAAIQKILSRQVPAPVKS